MVKVGKTGVKVLFAMLISAVFCIFFSSSVSASDGDLVINEIYPSPSKVGDDVYEWVEIFNNGVFSVDLSLYKLQDGANAAKPISKDKDILNPGEYFIYQTTSNWLNGQPDGDIVFLIDSEGIITDKVAYGKWDKQVLDTNTDTDRVDNAIAPINGQSISRIPDGADTNVDSDDFSIGEVTKGHENELTPEPPAIEYSDEIFINEILPEPSTSSSDEFIELYNGEEHEAALKDWYLVDKAGSKFIFSDEFIGAKGYLTLCKDAVNDFCDAIKHSIALNDNTAEELKLIDPNGDTKYTITYDKAKRGLSYSRFSDGWKWTLKLSPGQENVFEEEVEAVHDEVSLFIEENISTARKKQVEDTVIIKGAVTVLPEVLSSQYFYIEDSSAGIQIYSSKRLFPTLALGDIVQVTGELSESNGERRIKITSSSDILIIEKSKPPPDASRITIDEIDESYEGRYITIKGTVTKSSGNSFYIHGSGEIQVVIRDSADIKKPKMRKGDVVMISGIVSQYKDHYRILPTKQSDVIVLSSGSLPKAGPEMGIKQIVIIIIAWILSLIQRKKLCSLPKSLLKH